jgi:hypothetical protein
VDPTGGPPCRAMISSTSLDLPEHRQKLIEVCNRLGVVPLAMEHLGADGRTPAQVSLEMVDRADLYLLVLGWRYGFVPEGSTISITEMEYERALAQYRRGELSSILVFVSDAEHLFRTSDIDRDDSRVDRLRSRVALEHVIVQFRSVGDLGEKAIQSLSESLTEFRHSSTGGPPEIFRLPARPEPFTAHPYALLQTSRVIGRSEERALIDSWFRRFRGLSISSTVVARSISPTGARIGMSG